MAEQNIKNPFQFDFYDENQVIKLDNNDPQAAYIKQKSPKKHPKPSKFESSPQIGSQQEIKDIQQITDPNISTDAIQPKIRSHKEQEIPEVYSEDAVIMLQHQALKKVNSYSNYSNYKPSTDVNEDGDPPLLQDIGIDPSVIIQKFQIVIKLTQPTQKHIEMSDMAGPIAVAFALGFLLLAAGKVHFGDIYAFFIVGNILICILFNLMSKGDFISLYSVMSILGYSKLPLILPAALSIIMNVKNTFGILITFGFGIWCSISAVYFVQLALSQVNRKGVFIYPIFLYYVSFALLILF